MELVASICKNFFVYVIVKAGKLFFVPIGFAIISCCCVAHFSSSNAMRHSKIIAGHFVIACLVVSAVN